MGKKENELPLDKLPLSEAAYKIEKGSALDSANKEARKKKMKPAGKNDSFDVTYTHFKTDRQRNELSTGNGERFDNDVLLEMLGFKENENGEMAIKAYDGGKAKVSKEQDER